MKAYHIYFILLKILVVTQFILVFFKKTTENNDLYVLTDTLFKISIAVYLFVFFILNPFPGLEFEDTLILRFSAVVLLLDIDYTGLIKVLRKYNPSMPKIPFLEKY